MSKHPKPYPIQWGAETAEKRGPIVSIADDSLHGNAFGFHGDLYGFHRSMARVTGQLPRRHSPKLDLTEPAVDIGPFDTWKDPHSIWAIDPWGHRTQTAFPNVPNLYPSAAVNTSYYQLPEIEAALRDGRLKADVDHHNGQPGVLDKDGVIKGTEVVGEQVWYLPEVARNLGMKEREFRAKLQSCLCGAFPQLTERMDLKVFIPPIGGYQALILGDPALIGKPDVPITMRPHDSCDDGDIGALRCTCRAYLTFALEKCIEQAQEGGLGVLIRYVAQGRGFGSVPKHLVYQARESHPDGDDASRYFECTQNVMGGVDGRLDWSKVAPMLMLNVRRVSQLLTMSPHKMAPMQKAGIWIEKAVSLPDERIPARARVEIDAKVGSGYGAAAERADGTK